MNLHRMSHSILVMNEILNWTIIDVVDDISAAIWNLGTGFYKTSASCQRGALEMASVSQHGV